MWALVILLLAGGALQAHDVFSTKITWSREISRIVVQRCLGCHQTGGKAFSLATFEEARPWAKAIKEEVLNRRMPPWGAVKGFGDFKNDPSLTQEEISLIADWVEGGSPEGEKIYLPEMKSASFWKTTPVKGKARLVTGTFVLNQPGSILALEPQQLGSSVQVVAELPDGSTEPLVWILDPAQALHREYQFDSAVALPKGTRIVAPQGSWRFVFK
jgi:mono/diheme cytochrome c family protein